VVWLWVLLFVAIAVGGVLVLGYVVLRLWRSARGLLEELDVVAVRAGELADLLAQIEVVEPAGAGTRTPRPRLRSPVRRRLAGYGRDVR
jgi:hypothetical protein